MNKILLYNPRPNPHLRPTDIPLALLCISRFLSKDGYDIKIANANLYDDCFGMIRAQAKESSIFAVSALTGYQIKDGLYACEIARSANPDIKIIWGGWHTSLYPAQVLENPLVDIAVRGPGERVFHEIVKRIEKKEDFAGVAGVSWKKDGEIYSNADRPLESIDQIPPMPFHLVDIEKYVTATEFGKRTINYVSSYGCPHRCGFCCEPAVSKRAWVGLSAQAVVDDLEKLQKEYNIDGVSVIDSNFFVDIRRAKDIFREMLKRRLAIRLGNLDGRTRQLSQADDELWELLRQTKCYSILAGAESGSDESLKIMNKDILVEDTIRFAKKSRKFGIKVNFTSLVGIPIPGLTHEELARKTDEQIQATIKMFNTLLSLDRRHRGQMFLYVPYPGTPLYQNAIQLGFQEPKNLLEWANYTFFENYTPWITKKQKIIVPMISSYIFLFLDVDTLGWLKPRIKGALKRILFTMAFKIFEFTAKLRWKFKFFRLPIDYHIFTFIKSKNRDI